MCCGAWRASTAEPNEVAAETTLPLQFMPRARRTRLARVGDWMATHRSAILAAQWLIVVFYGLLVVVPAFLPHPNPEARLFSSDFGAASFVDPSYCATDGSMPSTQDKPP